MVAATKNDREAVREMANNLLMQDTTIIARMAREAAIQARTRGEPVAWPPSVSERTASKESDFPHKIWLDAQLRWLSTGTQQEKEQKTQRLAAAFKLSTLADEPKFQDSFSPFDLLWLGLAIVTGFKVGVGSYGRD